MVPLEKEDYRQKSSTRGPLGQKMLNFTTPGDRHQTVIENLLPYTLYNVTGMISNVILFLTKAGRSQAIQYIIRGKILLTRG